MTMVFLMQSKPHDNSHLERDRPARLGYQCTCDSNSAVQESHDQEKYDKEDAQSNSWKNQEDTLSNSWKIKRKLSRIHGKTKTMHKPIHGTLKQTNNCCIAETRCIRISKRCS